MARFWIEILPMVPPKRGNEVSAYCVKLHEQALAYLKDNNKPKEAKLSPPGISVLKTPSPGEAATEMRTAYPDATGLYEAAKTVGSSTLQAIRSLSFDVIPTPSKRLPNHHRLIHPDGAAGFSDEKLQKLSEAFTDTTEV